MNACGPEDGHCTAILQEGDYLQIFLRWREFRFEAHASRRLIERKRDELPHHVRMGQRVARVLTTAHLGDKTGFDDRRKRN